MKKIVLILIITVATILAGCSRNTPPEEFSGEDNITSNKAVEKTDYEYYNFTSEYSVTVKNAKDVLLEISVSLPENIKGKQIIKELTYSPEPKQITRENGRKTAVYEFENPPQVTKITVSGQAGIRTYDLMSAQENPNAEKQTFIEKKYILPEQFIESKDGVIVSRAKELRGSTKLQTIKNIYYFVQRNMRYDVSKDTVGAKELLKTRKGKCSDYAALMVALLRANSIPARVVSGNIVAKDSVQHTWVEVNFEDLGWVEFEPTVLSTSKPDFAHSPNKYLISGIDTTTPVIVKLNVPVKDNRPRPDILVLLENKTEFFNPETNEPI